MEVQVAALVDIYLFQFYLCHYHYYYHCHYYIYIYIHICIHIIDIIISCLGTLIICSISFSWGSPGCRSGWRLPFSVVFFLFVFVIFLRLFSFFFLLLFFCILFYVLSFLKFIFMFLIVILLCIFLLFLGNILTCSLVFLGKSRLPLWLTSTFSGVVFILYIYIYLIFWLLIFS